MNHRYALVFATSIATLLFQGTALAERKITSEEVGRAAQSHTAELAVRSAEVEVAAGELEQAASLMFPKLQASARATRLSDVDAPIIGYAVGALPQAGDEPRPLAPGTQLFQAPIRFPVLLNQVSFQAMLAVPLSDYVFRLFKVHSAASLAYDAARLRERATKVRARSEGLIAFYLWAKAKLTESLASQAANQARARAAESPKEGVLSKAEVARGKAQLAAAEQLEVRARNFAGVLSAQIRILLGDTESESLALGENLEADVNMPTGLVLRDLLTEARGARVEVVAMTRALEAAEKQIDVARAAAYPRLDALAEVTAANPNPRVIPLQEKFITTWSLTAQLSWSPNDALTAKGSARSVAGKHAQLVAEQQQLLDGLRIEVAQAIESVSNSEMAQRVSAANLDAAEEALKLRRALYANGRASATELNEAEAEVTRARLDRASAHIECHIAKVKLDHATGRDLSYFSDER